MRSQLLFKDRPFDWSQTLPWNTAALEFDLSLSTLYQAMARDDPIILDSARKVILAAGTIDCETIRFRQAILQDCLDQRPVIEALYAIAGEAMQKQWGNYLMSLRKYPHWVLRDAVDHMERFTALLLELRRVIDSQGHRFQSEGWHAFFNRVRHDLSDSFFREATDHLKELKLSGGELMSTQLDRHGAPTAFVLHRYKTKARTLWQQLWQWLFPPLLEPNTFAVHPRDEAGARALEELRDDGIASAAIALANARDHIREFFEDFRSELAFYLGCANLHRVLAAKGEPICYPIPHAQEALVMKFEDLYDTSLALAVSKPVIGSTVDATQKRFILITGANQGGKSTFLRSVGLAQFMMQSGMFVGAKSFSSSICRGLYSHYKREESAALESGKFDEELARMSEIVDHLAPYSMVLFNESFAATNEREGSEISLQILRGLIDENIRIICVTHLYELARRLHQENRNDGLFLRPERKADGTRTFKLVQGEPLSTSHGIDIYRTVFSKKHLGKEVEDWADNLRKETKPRGPSTSFSDEYREIIEGSQIFESKLAELSLKGDFSYKELEKAEMELKQLQGWLAKVKRSDSQNSFMYGDAEEAVRLSDEHISRYAQRVFEAHTNGALPAGNPNESR